MVEVAAWANLDSYFLVPLEKMQGRQMRGRMCKFHLWIQSSKRFPNFSILSYC